MTISSSVRKAGPYSGGGTSLFPFEFTVFDASNVQVTVADVNGIETILTRDTDYTVTLNPDQITNPGGSISYALPDGYTLVILGDIAYDQKTELTNNGGYYPKVIEKAMDRLSVQIQQLAEGFGRSVKVKATDTTDPEQLVADLKDSAALAVQNADKASTSASEAKASQTAAAVSQTASKTSENNSKSSENAAANSATAANASAQNAYTSSQNANLSALAAAASATDANNSKETTHNYAASAQLSATDATNSSNSASVSANAAANSASSASASAEAAAASASKVNFPDFTNGDAEKVLAVKNDLSGFELKDVTTIASLANFLALNSSPVGTVIMFSGANAPTNYLKIPTAATNVSRTAYAALFAVIGTTYGSGDGSTTFGLPYIGSGGAALQGTVGTTTAGVMPSHAHSYTVINYPNLSWGAGVNGSWGMISGTSNGTTGATGSGSLNLAAGSYFTFAIKYQ